MKKQTLTITYILICTLFLSSVYTFTVSAQNASNYEDDVILLPSATESQQVSQLCENPFTYKSLVTIPGFTDKDGLVTICPSSLGVFLQTAFNYIIGIAILLTVVMVIYGGVQYATVEAINGKSQAKATILGALQGLALALGSVLILTTINPDLVKFHLDLGRLNLRTASEGGTGVLVELGSGISVVQNTSYYNNSSGGGSCKIPTNPTNLCSVENLSKTCFSSIAVGASKVCNLESGGRSICSGSDKLNRGAGPSYSCGLWQINLTVWSVAGLDCPSAFTGPCGPNGTVGRKAGLRIGNCTQSIRPGKEGLYQQCVAAANNPKINQEFTCSKIYKGNLTPWKTSARTCNVPL